MDVELLQKRVRDFAPEPLITPATVAPSPDVHMVEDSAETVDLAKVNYLNVLHNLQIKNCAEEVIREYGVGTCGPRAFYGTTDVHLTLEENLARFLKMQDAILYSFGFVAISSSIAAYCRKTDVVFVDEMANFAISQGLVAAKSHVVKYQHNNFKDLERMAYEYQNAAKRKFLIVEAINWETGKLCPLPDFLRVAEQFKMRIFLEESYSLGVLGTNGRGLTEHFRVDPERIDMIFGTLEGAIGSIGGFCAGSTLTIEHQRLSGAGYIFSASLPTYLVQVVIKSLEMMGDTPVKLVKFSGDFHKFLKGVGFDVESDHVAPFKVVHLDTKQQERAVWEYCKERGVHFIEKERGLVMHLNVALVDDGEKLGKVKRVLGEAYNFVKK